jgi:hypothetical protein
MLLLLLLFSENRPIDECAIDVEALSKPLGLTALKKLFPAHDPDSPISPAFPESSEGMLEVLRVMMGSSVDWRAIMELQKLRMEAKLLHAVKSACAAQAGADESSANPTNDER